jgi:dethiobiotin synthetase
MKVKSLISNDQSKFHEEAFRLNEPMSPHAAAEKDKVHIDISSIKTPLTNNHLVIEGAGGLLVPLNDKETILNLIETLRCEVILVSRHYLGSINHTLMSIEILKQRNIQIKGILFNGDENKDTEAIISKMSNIHVLGRIAELTNLNKSTINSVAQNLKNKLN